jgi:hypothetical protein
MQYSVSYTISGPSSFIMNLYGYNFFTNVTYIHVQKGASSKMLGVRFSSLKLTISCGGVGPIGRNYTPNFRIINQFSTQEHGHNETEIYLVLLSKLYMPIWQ